jgi:hypothetical protein
MAQTSRAFDKIQEIQRRKLAAVPKTETGIPAKEPGIPVTAVPVSETGIPVSVKTPRESRVYPARVVQDGHSHGEQALYDALWHHPQSVRMPDGSRRITIGRTGLARASRMTANNAAAALRSLISKLAIVEEGSAGQMGHVYRVRSFTEIMDLRRAAGLTAVIRVSKAVKFVTGIPISGIPERETGTPETEIPGVPETGETGIPKTAPHMNRHLVLETEERKDACPRCSGTGWLVPKVKRCGCPAGLQRA